MGLDLKKSKDMDILMKEFQLAIVGSVQPGMPWTKSRLDNLESDLQQRCLLKHDGGIGREIKPEEEEEMGSRPIDLFPFPHSLI